MPEMSFLSWIILVLDIGPTFVTIIGNGTFFMTIWITKSLHTPSNILFLLLTITDLIAGLTCQPLFIMILLKPNISEWPHIIMAYNLIFTLLSFNSHLCITLISLNRVIAVVWPLRYRKYIFKKRILSVTIVIFVLSSIIIPIQTMFAYHEVAFCLFYLATHGCTLLFVMGSYCVLCLAIKRRNRVSVALQMETSGGRRLSCNTERATTRIIAMITLAFFICHIPYLVYRIHHLYHELNSTEEDHSFVPWVNFLILIHSALNPMIYFASRKDIRLAAWRLFHKKIIANNRV